MSLAQAQSRFINAPKFAVIGRVLTDRQRWDNKVLRWYTSHDLPVTPILPSADSKAMTEGVEGLKVLSDPTTIQNLSETSISIIINPVIGLSILKTLYPPPTTTSRVTRSNSDSTGPRGIWFQPGAESPEIREYVKEMGLEGKVICSGNGECILEDGDEVLKMRKIGNGIGSGSRL